MQNKPTPETLAREARARGDRLFEIQLEVGESSRDVRFGAADSGSRTEQQHAFVGVVASAGVLVWWSARALAASATDVYEVRDVVADALWRSIAFMLLVALVAALAARVTMQMLESSGRC